MRFLVIFLFSVQLLSAQVWVKLADFPAQKRDDGVAVVVNNKAYFGTGLIEWANTSDFYVLDLTNYSWNTMAAMPNGAERQYACAFAGQNCFYVFGGAGTGGVLNTLYKYNVGTNTWIQVSSKPGNGLSGAACMNFGDKILISGGRFPSGKVSPEVWEYTISTDSWMQKNDYPFVARWRSSATVHNNAGYLIFGRDSGGAYCKEFYKYTPATDNWTKIMDFPGIKGRSYASLNVANNQLFVFGGTDTLDFLYKDLWYFKETTTTWVQGPDIPASGRKGGMSCSYDDKFFYTCGIGEGPARLTETWMTDIPVGIKEHRPSGKFNVYPNPTNGPVHVRCADKNLIHVTCIYEDLSGRVLGSMDLKAEDRINLSSLNPGIYILKLYSGKTLVEIKRIVKD